MESKTLYDKKFDVFSSPLRVAFSGKIASGKTTLSAKLEELYNLNRISFAYYLKIYCSNICEFSKTKKLNNLVPVIEKICRANNYSIMHFMAKTMELAEQFKDVNYFYSPDSSFTEDKKNENGRKMLQFVGHNMREWFSSDIWINTVLSNLSLDGRYISDDLRYPNELDALKRNGFFLIRLNVSEEIQKERTLKKYGSYDESVFTHPTEVLLDKEVFDFYLDTNGSVKTSLNKLLNIMAALDKISNKINNILTKGKEDDYRRAILMELKNYELEGINSTDYNSFGYRALDSKSNFT